MKLGDDHERVRERGHGRQEMKRKKRVDIASYFCMVWQPGAKAIDPI